MSRGWTMVGERAYSALNFIWLCEFFDEINVQRKVYSPKTVEIERQHIEKKCHHQNTKEYNLHWSMLSCKPNQKHNRFGYIKNTLFRLLFRFGGEVTEKSLLFIGWLERPRISQ